MNISSQFSFMPYVSEQTTQGDIIVTCSAEKLNLENALDDILNNINHQRGAIFSSSYEYPDRYSRWDVGFVNPCIEIKAYSKHFQINALNERGQVLLISIYNKLNLFNEIQLQDCSESSINGQIIESDNVFSEEKRSKQPTVFTMIRAINELLYLPGENILGLYGAFGYDLIFQFEPIEFNHLRDDAQPDMVLYLPDSYVVVDHQLAIAYNVSYEFRAEGKDTAGLERSGPWMNYEPETDNYEMKEHKYGDYAKIVKEALKSFKKGDLFEVVASQTIYKHCSLKPSEIFQRLKKINPSPYGFIINMGSEFLVGASPEMFVRVEGDRVETCPISGTIKRGKNAIEDAEQIRLLLDSRKEESELTMCTDVDRNDKSRICIPGSVRVISRRQLEIYSRLIHTVDHVEGTLDQGYDALDAFLTHMWSVTVTGAPKKAAIKWLETHESSTRKWYGGAVGFMTFDGNLNTGLTLRTINLKNGLAEIKVGATLLYDSNPEDEENETYIKASALLSSIDTGFHIEDNHDIEPSRVGQGKRILFVDHEDSFVLTLANYFKQTGAEVSVFRAPYARQMLSEGKEHYDLVVLSPGPGQPADFQLNETIKICIAKRIPTFGVCLGLQGIVEYFGGVLDELTYPQHGKSSIVKTSGHSKLWVGLQSEFTVGRYHSLYALEVPEELCITAVSEDGVVMAIEHVDLPIVAVQFHPESIMTLKDDVGLRIIENMISYL
ncbi:anthranilate synthase component I [Paenibacillus tepidiphilus]|uniref:anthranilate synthase component I n=1 Tax=Paenibacillus tepidiphilus TaxID=2608683 RepID=UPI00123A9CE8|nr:anthranilate synthase component I [Paenibacillus tepidiphilus]